MTIEQTSIKNKYRVYDEDPIAEFEVVENRVTGITEVLWHYGSDAVPLDVLSEIHQIQYAEEEL